MSVSARYSNISTQKRQIIDNAVEMMGYTGDIKALENSLDTMIRRYPDSAVQLIFNSARDNVQILAIDAEREAYKMDIY